MDDGLLMTGPGRRREGAERMRSEPPSTGTGVRTAW
jgi:hypothetical protein